MRRQEVDRVRGLLAALLVVAALAFSALAAAGWPGSTHSCVASGDCYCEAPRPGAIAQPSNTWSCLGWLAAGIAVAWHFGRRRSAATPANRMTDTLFYPALYAFVAGFLTLGGMAFHASLTEWGGRVDVVSMYLFVDFWIFYNLARLYDLSQRTFLALYLGATGALLVPRVVFGSIEAGLGIFAALVLAGLLTECAVALPARLRWLGSRRALRVERGWFWVGLGAFLLGRWAEENLPCVPDSLWQRHALLHLLEALTVWALYLYLRRERAAA